MSLGTKTAIEKRRHKHPKIEGGCLCGTVRFRIDNNFSNLLICHCKQCRKTTGAGSAANLISTTGSLELTNGADLVTTFRHPTRYFTKAFCGLCGGAVPYLNHTETLCFVPAGSLEGEPEVTRQDNIFTEERPDWCTAGYLAENHIGFGSVFEDLRKQ